MPHIKSAVGANSGAQTLVSSASPSLSSLLLLSSLEESDDDDSSIREFTFFVCISVVFIGSPLPTSECTSTSSESESNELSPIEEEDSDDSEDEGDDDDELSELYESSFISSLDIGGSRSVLGLFVSAHKGRLLEAVLGDMMLLSMPNIWEAPP